MAGEAVVRDLAPGCFDVQEAKYVAQERRLVGRLTDGWVALEDARGVQAECFAGGPFVALEPVAVTALLARARPPSAWVSLWRLPRSARRSPNGVA